MIQTRTPVVAERRRQRTRYTVSRIVIAGLLIGPVLLPGRAIVSAQQEDVGACARVDEANYDACMAIRAFLQSTLHRDPDDDEVAYWLGALQEDASDATGEQDQSQSGAQAGDDDDAGRGGPAGAKPTVVPACGKAGQPACGPTGKPSPGQQPVKPDPAKARELREQAAQMKAKAAALRGQATGIDDKIKPLTAQISQLNAAAAQDKAESDRLRAEAASYRKTAVQWDNAAAYDPKSALGDVTQTMRGWAATLDGVHDAVLGDFQDVPRVTVDTSQNPPVVTLGQLGGSSVDQQLNQLGINPGALVSDLRSRANALDSATSGSALLAARDQLSGLVQAWQATRDAVWNATLDDRQTIAADDDIISRKQGELRYWQHQLDDHTAAYNALWAIDPRRLYEGAAIQQANVAIADCNLEMDIAEAHEFFPSVRVTIANIVIGYLNPMIAKGNTWFGPGGPLYTGTINIVAYSADLKAQAPQAAADARSAASADDTKASASDKKVADETTRVSQLSAQRDPLVKQRDSLVAQAAGLETQARQLESSAACAEGHCPPPPPPPPPSRPRIVCKRCSHP